MGEYFAWANLDKCERLATGPFTAAFKFVEPCWVGNIDVDAVCTLLAGRWKGDTIAFLGDESTDFWPDTSPKALEYRKTESPVFRDYADDYFKDVTGLFKKARGMKYTVYTDDDFIELPYEGPFTLEIEHKRYVTNHTRQLYYDRTRTPVRCVWPHQLGGEEKIVRFDPFPVLFEKDSRLDAVTNHANSYFEQDWVGDAIEVSDEQPPSAYLDVSTFYDYWTPSLVADDGVILEAMESDEYRKLAKTCSGSMDALKRMLPEYVVRTNISEPRCWPPSGLG